jgi:thiamine biosynthesis protein ThiI
MYLVCHYHEIGLKGKNRDFFERKLIENLKLAIEPEYFRWVKRFPGRIVIELTDKGEKNLKRVKEAVGCVFGISYFAPAYACEPKLEEINKVALELVREKRGKTFKIETKRSNKLFPYSSSQLNALVGEYVLKRVQTKKVKLENPKITCFIEILPKVVFLYAEKIKGPGGLPVTTAGKVVSLLSGGIDSPVASFLMQKRGAKIIFVHFHAYPYTSKASIEKAKKITKLLNRYQFSSNLYLVPFLEIQKETLLKTKAKFRVILYRRGMFKIAEKIAQKENALGLVTGESLGQVASQTLENIKAIDEAVDLPVFRPLIGMDKEEIIQLAKKIGTYEISILPHEDCCARFLPKHPETKANLEDIKKEEKGLNLKLLIQKAFKETKVLKI